MTSIEESFRIALTAYVEEFDQQQAIAAGFQRRVNKPLEQTKLI